MHRSWSHLSGSRLAGDLLTARLEARAFADELFTGCAVGNFGADFSGAAGLFGAALGGRDGAFRRLRRRRLSVRCPCRLGGLDTWALEDAWLGSRSDWRLAMVLGRAKLRYGACNMNMRNLSGSGRNMPRFEKSLLLRRRSCRQSAGTAVVADGVESPRIPDCVLVYTLEIRHIAEIVVCSVVEQRTIAPIRAVITFSVVSISVGDATVIRLADPITLIEHVDVVVVGPVARSPEEVRLGRLDPGTRYPAIVAVTPQPISGHPVITRIRNVGLVIDWQWGRWNVGLNRHNRFDGGLSKLDTGNATRDVEAINIARNDIRILIMMGPSLAT